MKQVRVQWDLNVYSYALIGALLKSAYLALFRMLGYAWVNGPCGDKVRRALNDFFQARGDKDNAHEFFGEFEGCCTAGINDFFEDWPDTLTGNEVLFHFAPDPVCGRLLFSLSCLFRINGKMFVVTVPTYMAQGHYSVAFSKYRDFLKDRSIDHETHAARFLTDHWEYDPDPLDVRVLSHQEASSTIPKASGS